MNVAYVGECCTLLQPQASSESLATQSVRCPANLRALRLEKARVCIGLFHWNSPHVHGDRELYPLSRLPSQLKLHLVHHLHRNFRPKSEPQNYAG